ncbi:hypothetical protein GGI05_003886 [Coemansia sp. RSA 2603]|nr:hypothetical protein GGI05_003886 [Coemansia sp. RSA 2603]
MRLNNFQSGTSVELIAHPEDQSKANDTNTRAIYEKRITRIRADTDNAFTTKIFQLWFPIAVLLLTSSFYRLGYRASMGVIFRDMVHSVIMLTNATASAIQLVVNHRARSGSLVPIGLTLCTIFVHVDYKIFSHYCGFDIFHLSIFDELIIVVPSAIHIAQWVAFYKSKQE